MCFNEVIGHQSVSKHHKTQIKLEPTTGYPDLYHGELSKAFA